MRSINIALVEDDNNAKEQFIIFLNDYFKDKNVNIFPFTSGEEFFESNILSYDIVFLDIELPGINGVSIAKLLREKNYSKILIFTTNLAQYALKGYEVDALCFLVKPINYFTLKISLDKAIKVLSKEKSKKILVNNKNEIASIDIDNIYYFEVINHDVIIHTTTELISIRKSLKSFENELHDYNFRRCNNCYLVNLKHVNKIKKDSVVVGFDELLFSRNKKKQFIDDISKYVGENL